MTDFFSRYKFFNRNEIYRRLNKIKLSRQQLRHLFYFLQIFIKRKTSTRNWFLLLNSNFWNRFLRKFGKRFLFSFSPFTNYDKDPGTARSALEQRAEPKAVSLIANKNSFKARWNSAQIYIVKVSRNIKANKKQNYKTKAKFKNKLS